nr:hypothetical protein [Tanacetum cinerariifolium]
EARMSREAWVRATDTSDLVHGEVMSLRTTVLGQMSEIRELQAADRRRQTVILELLRIDHRRSTEISELRTALQGQAMFDQGVTVALAAPDALRSTNGDDSHNSRTGAPKELPVFPNGVKEWSPSFTSTTALPKIKSSLLHALSTLVVAYKPKKMQEAIEIATKLMDKKIRTFAKHEIASKRKFENTSRNTQNQQ